MKKIFIGIGIIILSILGYANTRSDIFTVERKLLIKAPKEKIYYLINNFDEWPKWSPWDKLDPNIKKTLSSNRIGKGAKYEWEGNSDVGKGKMEILESAPDQIKIKLDFMEPFEGNNITTFTFLNRNDSIEVIWNMTGPENYFGKLIGIFVDLDKMVGKDFELGLNNLKKLTE